MRRAGTPLLWINHVSPIIDHKAFAFDEADGKRDFDDALEHVAQKVAVAEVAATVLRETGVVRHGVIKIQPAEPAIDHIQRDCFAQLAFGPDAIAVADDCIQRSSSGSIEGQPVWLQKAVISRWKLASASFPNMSIWRSGCVSVICSSSLNAEYNRP